MRRYLSTLVLGVVLCAPVAMQAKDKDNHHVKRYYDRANKDYHEWGEAEDRAYRHWLEEERHERYRPWARARRRDQLEYWRWRHQHSDWH